ncbi:putative aminopeptidase npepl1 [Boothiomyces sp. JEL0866]|nr:putative aminopeptidase npepl1 [Boothiomyces sp. JEL0866]
MISIKSGNTDYLIYIGYNLAEIKQKYAVQSDNDFISILNEKKQISFFQFENKVSRNLVIRTDLISEKLKLLPKDQDIQIILVLDTFQEVRNALPIANSFPIYSKKTSSPQRNVYLDFICKEKVDYQELNVLLNGILKTQLLVDMPPNELNTNRFVEEAQSLVKRLNNQHVSIKVIEGEELKHRFGGIYNVGKAAMEPPRLVVLSYLPPSDKTICLVGKGIVYDSGGLSIKATLNMCGMKHDMGGAASVLASFESIVTQKLPKKVHALLCLAENAVSSKSLRNDDIITMYSGKTVEVNNTDAEGRLVLSDGVAYSSRNLKPDLIIDIATLTGAQLITTGLKHAAILTPSEKTEQFVIKCGKNSGDLVYPILYAPEILLDNFKSKVADLKNSVKDRMNAQCSCAGHFIEQHLGDYQGEWCHVDIAGPASHEDRGTGFGASLLYEIVKQY